MLQVEISLAFSLQLLTKFTDEKVESHLSNLTFQLSSPPTYGSFKNKSNVIQDTEQIRFKGVTHNLST